MCASEMGLTNLRIMVPFCRRVEEAEQVIEAMARHGLQRGENGLEIYVMCEIPNNVIQIDAFAAVFDGFSIGSNDLTQLTLGVDRDSEIVAFDFDERDPGMLEMLRLAVAGAQAQRPPCRHLRRGAGELSGDRAVPGRARHRFDQRQSFQPAAHDRRGARSGGETDRARRSVTPTNALNVPCARGIPAAIASPRWPEGSRLKARLSEQPPVPRVQARSAGQPPPAW